MRFLRITIPLLFEETCYFNGLKRNSFSLYGFCLISLDAVVTLLLYSNLKIIMYKNCNAIFPFDFFVRFIKRERLSSHFYFDNSGCKIRSSIKNFFLL